MKKFFMKIIVLVLIAFSSLLSGCATIFKGSTEEVFLNSKPSGAKVYDNGVYVGKTPLQTDMLSKFTHTIEFVKKGYEKKAFFLPYSLSGGYLFLDLFLPLGLIIDLATGNWNSLDQDEVIVQMEMIESDDESGENKKDSTRSEIDEVSDFQYSKDKFLVEVFTKEKNLILNDRISINYTLGYSQGFISFEGILGISGNQAGPFEQVTRKVFFGDVFFLKVDPELLYKVEIKNQVDKTLELLFVKQ